MRCDDVSELLAASPDGVHLPEPAAARHVETCLRCQAELVQYRKLLRALRALRSETIPSPGLVADILATIEEAGARDRVRARRASRSAAAYVSGLAVATAAAGAGAIVLATRGRGRRVRIAG